MLEEEAKRREKNLLSRARKQLDEAEGSGDIATVVLVGNVPRSTFLKNRRNKNLSKCVSHSQ